MFSSTTAKKSWPNGVTSWEDIVTFAQLVFGVDVAYESGCPSSRRDHFCCLPKVHVEKENHSAGLQN